MKPIILAAIIAAGSIGVSAAASPTLGPLDMGLRDQTLVGIRLGMSPSEAIAAAVEHKAISDPSIIWYRYGPCERERIALIRDKKLSPGSFEGTMLNAHTPPPDRCVYSIDADPGLGKPALRVMFTEDWPAHPGSMMATFIHFRVPTSTEADVKSLREKALEHFGRPTAYVDTSSYTSVSISTPRDSAPGEPPGLAWLTHSCFAPPAFQCELPWMSTDIARDARYSSAALLLFLSPIGGGSNFYMSDGPTIARVSAAIWKNEEALGTGGVSL